MRVQDAKRIPLSTLLAALGHSPVKESHGEAWYLSPFRQENTASFKLSADGRAFYDHGLGKGGNIVDFAMLYFRCSLSSALAEIERHVNVPPREVVMDGRTPLLPHMVTDAARSAGEQGAVDVRVKPEGRHAAFSDVKLAVLHEPRLLAYLKKRAVPPLLARDYLQEIHYTYRERRYFALAFANDSGGFEMRNPYFKGIYGRKTITTLYANEGRVSEQAAVFEGFFDFLSALVWDKSALEHCSVIVMNSAALKQQTCAALTCLGVRSVDLYLDRDAAGIALKTEFENARNGLTVVDRSALYAEHKDFNAFLQAQRGEIKTSERSC